MLLELNCIYCIYFSINGGDKTAARGLLYAILSLLVYMTRLAIVMIKTGFQPACPMGCGLLKANGLDVM